MRRGTTRASARNSWWSWGVSPHPLISCGKGQFWDSLRLLFTPERPRRAFPRTSGSTVLGRTPGTVQGAWETASKAHRRTPRK